MPILKRGGFIDKSGLQARIDVCKSLLKTAAKVGKEDHPAAIEWRVELEELEAVNV